MNKNVLKEFLLISSIILLTLLPIINGQHLPLCDSLNKLKGNENNENNSNTKSQGIRAIHNTVYSSRATADNDELDLIPDFDLNQINSGKEL